MVTVLVSIHKIFDYEQDEFIVPDNANHNQQIEYW